MGARKLGLSEVPCIRLAHLTETQKRAYIIADNKLALNAGWDEEILSLEFSDILGAGFDLELTGFAPGETSTPNFEPGTEDDQGRLDEKQKATCPNCGHEF
jgi:ParB-like chromosome segregation protein Spo0J